MTKTQDDIARDRQAASTTRSSSGGQNHEANNLPGMVTAENNQQQQPSTNGQDSPTHIGGPSGCGVADTVGTGQNHERENEVDLNAIFKEHNLRLLPNVANSIHIIDGQEERYFVGIIDILGQYTVKKKLETLMKSFLFPRTPFSSVNSTKYAKRFQEYIAQHAA